MMWRGNKSIMADQEFQTSNQDDESRIVTTLLQQYHDIAAQLASNVTPESTVTTLGPIQSQNDTIQIAFLKELAKEKTVEAANIEQAIQTLSPSKEVRKEARRRVIQLEASNIYPTWTPESINTFSQVLEQVSGEGSLPAETESLLSELETLFRQDGGRSDTPSFQATVENFLESWHNEDFVDAYALLSQESPIKEGLSQEDWIERRETWTRKVTPNDMQIMFFHTDNENLEEASQEPNVVDVGLSLELTNPQPLIEWPSATISLPETGRHWYWLRYTLVREEDDWFIQAVTNQASAILTLPVEELIQRIQSSEAELQEISERITEHEADEDEDFEADEFIDEDGNSDVQLEVDETVVEAEVIDATLVQTDGSSTSIEVVDVDLTDEDDDEDDEDDEDFAGVSELLDGSLDDMDSMVRLVTQSLHYYDAIFAQEPAKYAQFYRDAFSLAKTIQDIERAIVYVRQAAIHSTEERSEIFLNLALSYQALAARLHEEEDHEREGKIEDLIEPTLRQSIAIDENPTNLTALATILLLNDGDIDAAKEYYDKAQKGPLTPELTVNIETGLGEIAIQDEEYAIAIKHFQTLSTLIPEEPNIWYRLGYLHHQLEHFNEAIKALQQCIEIDPELTDAYTELAGIYTTQGNPKLAREIIQEGLDENPEAADLYATMALIYMHTGDFASANRQLNKAEALDSEDDFVNEARQRYNSEVKSRPTNNKAQQKQKQNKAKKR